MGEGCKARYHGELAAAGEAQNLWEGAVYMR